MAANSSISREEYIKRRYRRWRNMVVPFAYKLTKSIRLAHILNRTGGLPPVALELGVGPGGIAAPISQRGPRVIGVDLSADALERARAYCQSHRVILLRASGFALPFREASLPLVYASQVLHLFDNDSRLQLMGEVRRVLRPGGRFVFDLKNAASHQVRYWTSPRARRRTNFPTTREVNALLRRAGFVGIELRPGVMPAVGAVPVPNLALFRAIAHTRFFIARKP